MSSKFSVSEEELCQLMQVIKHRRGKRSKEETNFVVRLLLPVAFFQNYLQSSFAPALIDAFVVEHFGTNAFVFKYGDLSDRIFFVLSGRLDVLVPNERGIAVVVQTLYPGEIFGEFGVFNQRPRAASVLSA